MTKKSIQILLLIMFGATLVVFEIGKTSEIQKIKSILPAKVQNLVFTQEDQKQKVLIRAQATIDKVASVPSHEHLEAQIDEIDRILQDANAFERMNSNDLDDATRAEFNRLIIAKQKLLELLIEQEVNASRDLLAGAK